MGKQGAWGMARPDPAERAGGGEMAMSGRELGMDMVPRHQLPWQ